jgi:carbon starvation protein
MSPTVACLIAFAIYALAYRFYAGHLSKRVFALDPDRATPAVELEDGVDYVPTNRFVLFGHHYASITGLAPMLGPAVAVIWGWVPAMLWVVFGAILIGCVHDFGALVVSVRAKGMSIGKVAEGIIGPRAKTLFHLIIFFGIGLAMGVFVFVIAKLFSLELGPGKPGYPQSVLPSGGLMVVAMGMGWLLYRKGWRLLPLTAAGFVIQLLLVRAGMEWPTLGLDESAWPSAGTWTWILLAYAFAASVLPVWSLLQPRDFLNSLLLYLGLGATYLGFFVMGPEFAAPAVVAAPEGAPPLFPFVFIVIACGAASGFHSLVSSGTTAKQLARETDARFIGYGGMLGESLLGLLAVLACTAGFAGPELWHGHYGNWASAAGGLAIKIDAFIGGCTRFLTGIGVPETLGASFIATVVVSFALTTLDSATRLLRFNIEEVGETLGLAVAKNRLLTAGLAVGVIAWFAFYEVGGKPAALALWTLFGTVNQILAGLALLVVTLYLKQRGRSPWFTGVPMIFMFATTLTAMVRQMIGFAGKGQILLLVIDGLLLAIAIWLIIEAALALRRGDRFESLDIVV